MAILRKIEHRGYNVWAARPALASWEKVRLIAETLVHRLGKDTGGLTYGLFPGSLVCLLRTAGTPARGELLPGVPRLAAGPAARHVRPVRVLARLGRSDGRTGRPRGEAAGAVALAPRPGSQPSRESTRIRLHAAFHDTLVAYHVPREYLDAVLDGVEMDLEAARYPTFGDLYRYCYRVASAVGLACIHIWGCSREDAKKYAEKMGIGFQLTNILRDLSEDAARGRVYLPQEDLERFGYTPEALSRGDRGDRFRELDALRGGAGAILLRGRLAAGSFVAARRTSGLLGDGTDLLGFAQRDSKSQLRCLQQPGQPEPVAQSRPGAPRLAGAPRLGLRTPPCE